MKKLVAFIFVIIFSIPAHAVERGLSRQVGTPFLDGTYRALIIGNNDYKDETGTWKPLNRAVSDAKMVASILREHYGFTDVEVLINATGRQILLAMDALSDRAKENDSILLYYAGHGYMEEDKNRGYWVPVDARGQDHTTFIRNSTIRDELELLGQRVKHTLLISDSCFSGSLLRGGNRGSSVVKGDNLYYKKVAQKRSIQILAAGGMEYVDDSYRDSGHSPFTYFLLNELKHNDNHLLTATELSTQVQKAVANNVAQTPEAGVLADAGDELGEFIFSKINVKVEIIVEPAGNGKTQPASIPVTVEPTKIIVKERKTDETSTKPTSSPMLVTLPYL